MAEYFATPASNNAAKAYHDIKVSPYAGSLGADIEGIDVKNLSDNALAELKQASREHLVLFIRDQELGLDSYQRFAEMWGPLGEDPYLESMSAATPIVRLVKEADEKAPLVFGGSWHSDWSFLESPPAYTFLYAVDIPEYGGDTLYSNMYLVYEWLSDEMKRICESLTVLHSAERGYGPNAHHNALFENMKIKTSESALTVQEHALVQMHPETKRKLIFANPVYTVGIKGMKPEESAPLLNYLYSLAEQHAFICRLRWQQGTIAIWDNRCTWHLPISDYQGLRREMHRITIAG